MKKITPFLILLLAIASTSFAQQLANVPFRGIVPKGGDVIHYNAQPRLRNQVLTIPMDYDLADAQNYNTGEYLGYIWNSNMHYSLAANNPVDSFGMNYCIVAFDTLVDESTLTSYPRIEVVNGTMMVDTIQALISQVNNSGNPDTITVSIINLNGGASLWSTNIITDTGLSVNTTGGHHAFGYFHAITIPANFALPSGSNTFGVELQYFGDKRDTFAFGAGFGDPALAGCGQATTKASLSAYYPNSYAYWVSQQSLLPNSTGGDIYYDCNQDGKYEAGIDGNNYIQNIKILAQVTFTLDVALAVNDIKSNATLLNVYPNPSKDQTNISYSIQSSTNVIINVYDVTGKLVQSITKGTVTPGKYLQAVDLSKMASGIYSFSINTTEGKSFGKIAVTK